MKISTRQLAQTALLLAICIASQFLKNLSVYITGPVVNTTIIIAVLAVGLWSGIFISVIAPVTAFLISGSTRYFQKKLKFKGSLPAGLIAGSVLKAAFMGIVIVLVLLPAFGGNIAARLPKPEALPGVLATAKITFSVTQLITALTGSLLAYIIWMPLKKYLRAEG